MREAILRILQKDTQYVGILTNSFIEVINKLKDCSILPSSLKINTELIENISYLTYLILSYYGNKAKTFGEEYINATKTNISFILLFTKVLKPYILTFLLKNFRFIIMKVLKLFNLKNSKLYLSTVESIFDFDKNSMMDYLSEIEVCYFFIYSKFYYLCDWLYSSVYAFPPKQDFNSIFNEKGFKFIGYCLAYSVIFKSYHYIKTKYTETKRIYDKENKILNDIRNKEEERYAENSRIKNNENDIIEKAHTSLHVKSSKFNNLNNGIKRSINSNNNLNLTFCHTRCSSNNTSSVNENSSSSFKGKENIKNSLVSEERRVDKKLFSDFECILCLDSIINPSTTICGHMFCWNCISEYLQENPKCPRCRTQNFYNQLVPL